VVTAVEVLAVELHELADRHLTTPCHGADEWTSDAADDRAYAAAPKPRTTRRHPDAQP